MKTILALLLFAATAGAQTLISTNVLPFAYYTGTNYSAVWLETNIAIPRQRLLATHAGITNFNALGRSNVILRLQVQVSNTWTTIDTLYPSATNANVSDSYYSTASRVGLPFRIEEVTTNATGIGVFRQQLNSQ